MLILLSNLFVCCFLGKLESEGYNQMAISLYNSNWHKLPLDLQKYFIIMIANAQMRLEYHGYGFITLNLDNFCKVRTLSPVIFFFKYISVNAYLNRIIIY